MYMYSPFDAAEYHVCHGRAVSLPCASRSSSRTSLSWLATETGFAFALGRGLNYRHYQTAVVLTLVHVGPSGAVAVGSARPERKSAMGKAATTGARNECTSPPLKGAETRSKDTSHCSPTVTRL